jgi:hypothetical protein
MARGLRRVPVPGLELRAEAAHAQLLAFARVARDALQLLPQTAVLAEQHAGVRKGVARRLAAARLDGIEEALAHVLAIHVATRIRRQLEAQEQELVGSAPALVLRVRYHDRDVDVRALAGEAVRQRSDEQQRLHLRLGLEVRAHALEGLDMVGVDHGSASVPSLS